MHGIFGSGSRFGSASYKTWNEIGDSIKMDLLESRLWEKERYGHQRWQNWTDPASKIGTVFQNDSLRCMRGLQVIYSLIILTRWKHVNVSFCSRLYHSARTSRFSLSRLPTAAHKKFKQSYFEQNPIPRPRMLLSYSHRFPFKALRCKPHVFYAFRLLTAYETLPSVQQNQWTDRQIQL
jgi:hypothetical protein